MAQPGQLLSPIGKIARQSTSHLPRLTGSELDQLAGELNPLLRPESDISLDLEYPLLFTENHFAYHFAIRDQQDYLLSHAAVLVRHLVCGNRYLRFGMISNVVTRPEARSHGLAGTLIQRCLEQLQRSGCALAMVWSELEDFYGKYGFQRMGRELIFQPLAAALPQATAITMKPHHLPGITSLYNTKPVRVERSVTEMEKLLAIPAMDVFVHEDATGKPAAYLCHGKGEDFQDVIHECGGTPEAVLRLLGSLPDHLLKPSTTLLLSPMEKRLATMLERQGARAMEGTLGLAMVMDPNALNRFTAHLGPLANRYQGQDPFLPFFLEGLDSV